MGMMLPEFGILVLQYLAQWQLIVSYCHSITYNQSQATIVHLTFTGQIGEL